jgi:4-amino-4-deoxy-L-arabinose transferase-like glycosyltransferase
MNNALPKIRGDFSNVGENGPSLTPNSPVTRAYTLPKPHSFPSLRHDSRPRTWAWPLMIAVLSLTVFGWDLPSEPHFVDESAYLSQSFYADLLLSGDRDDPTWLSYAGYDLPPLPKYAIGWALRLQGHRRPGPSAMVAWYADTSRQFVSKQALVAARRPSVLFGAVGCLAIYGLGTMARDRRVGLLSALLLMANPLYAMHARRAMSDVYAESLILATAAVGLWSWKRFLAGKGTIGPALAMALGCGVLAGLATLSKLNGALGGLILGAWAWLAIPLSPCSKRGRATLVLATLAAGGVSFATFAALNPFLYAHPRGSLDPRLEPVARLSFRERVKAVYDHRAGISEHAQSQFPDNALRTPREKVEAVAVQGFGRFGPFGPRGRTDSTVRFDARQDRGAWVWLPWVALGLLAALIRGRLQLHQGEPPAAWAIVVQAIVAMFVVTSFIPLAWDRYFLSIQPGSALLASFAIVEGFDRLRSMFARKPLTESLV